MWSWSSVAELFSLRCPTRIGGGGRGGAAAVAAAATVAFPVAATVGAAAGLRSRVGYK